MIKKITLILIAFAALIGAAHANEEAKSKCKFAAEKYWDTGITSNMIEGNKVYFDCLLEDIEGGLSVIMQDDASRDAAFSEIKKAADAAWSARALIDNSNKSCDHGCGTMYLVVPATSAFQVLEDFQEKIVDKKRELGIDE